ncbi:MAG: hypothetical protein ACYC1Z_13465 [Georgenia sp.]
MATATPTDLLRLEIYSDIACNGGERLAVIPRSQVLECVSTFVAGVEDTVAVTVPYDIPASAYLSEESVIRVAYSTDADDFHEWRIAELGTVAGTSGRTRTILGVSPLVDLARCGILRGATGGASPILTQGVVALTLTEIWDQFIAPDLARLGVDYFTLGVVDPAALITLSWEWATPLEVWRAAIGQVPADDDGALPTLSIRRDGTTGYVLDVRQPAGGGLPTVDIRARKNLRDLKASSDARGYATVLYGKGAAGGTIGDTRWQVMEITGTNVVLGDPLGGPGPVAIADQLNGCALETATASATGLAYTARTAWAITVTPAGSVARCTLTLTDLADAALLAVGDRVQQVGYETLAPSRVTSVDETTGVVGLETSASVGTRTATGDLTRLAGRGWVEITGSAVGDGTFSTVTLSGAPTLTVGEWVRIAESTAGGALASLTHPANLYDYGRREGVLERVDIETGANLIPNAFCGAWAGATTVPPDGWAVDTGVTAGQVTDTAVFSAYALRITRASATDAAWATAPETAWVHVTPDRPFVHIRVRATLSAAAGQTFGVTLVDDAGTAVATATAETRIGEIDFGVRLALAAPGRYAVKIGKPHTTAAEAVDITVHAAQLVHISSVIAETSVPFRYGPAGNRLHQAVNRALLSGSVPPVRYEVTVDDLHRYDPATWAHDVLAIGAPARLTDTSLSVATTLRIVRSEVDHLVARDTRLTLGSLRPTLTDLLAQGRTVGGLAPTGTAPIVDGTPQPVFDSQPTEPEPAVTAPGTPLIPMYAGGADRPLGVVPNARTEVDAAMRVHCTPGGSPRLQGHVSVAGSESARVIACYFDDTGTPRPLGIAPDGTDGPTLSLATTGDHRGMPVAAADGARGEVLVGFFTEGGDDVTTATIGHVFLSTGTPTQVTPPTDPTVIQPPTPVYTPPCADGGCVWTAGIWAGMDEQYDYADWAEAEVALTWGNPEPNGVWRYLYSYGTPVAQDVTSGGWTLTDPSTGGETYNCKPVIRSTGHGFGWHANFWEAAPELNDVVFRQAVKFEAGFSIPDWVPGDGPDGQFGTGFFTIAEVFGYGDASGCSVGLGLAGNGLYLWTTSSVGVTGYEVTRVAPASALITGTWREFRLSATAMPDAETSGQLQAHVSWGDPCDTGNIAYAPARLIAPGQHFRESDHFNATYDAGESPPVQTYHVGPWRFSAGTFIGGL